ncbi:MAG: HAD-IB family phosphatase [Sphingomonadales bacterium]|nr:HAD-IB family phosphatase [Sphingomonadales bacterium]MBD3772269.1 HAD-IB family phosphatase [Paracoccaceae bacterium]
MRIAIYDLDRTLTRAPTFTPFLHFAAARLAPWRLAFSPVWIVLMLLYKAKLYSRTTLKRMGMKLMTGSAPLAELERVGEEFASRRIAAGGLMPGALQLLAEDRAAGARLVIATAAFGFYARAFAQALDIPDLIATRWDGRDIPGGNCYGAEKLARVQAWMEAQGIDPDDCTIRFVSDSFADAPLLDVADEAIFATGSDSEAARAHSRGWQAADLSRGDVG